MTRCLLLAFVSGLIGSSCKNEYAAVDFDLNYDETIPLDAEDLAEQGLGDAYESLLPKLRQYVAQPTKIEEEIDAGLPRYAVRFEAKEFIIYGPEFIDGEGNSWGRATFAFFTIVNDQMTRSEYRFYAINGGNDLCGIFLTPTQAQAARNKLPRKTDWPYLPKDLHPWYGQHH